MAEIEHYVDPKDKAHPRFSEAKDVKLMLLPKDVQERGETHLKEMTVGEAVSQVNNIPSRLAIPLTDLRSPSQGVVDNETLGYFLGRVQLFLEKIGIDPSRTRCRQHMANEMAHYATDCWDFEIKSSYGWIECVGCADRSAYDLTVHQNKTKQKLCVKENLTEPLIYDKLNVNIDAKAFGMRFKKDARDLLAIIGELSQDGLASLKSQMENGWVSMIANLLYRCLLFDTSSPARQLSRQRVAWNTPSLRI
jgi:glycyl-tRNA synthetase